MPDANNAPREGDGEPIFSTLLAECPELADVVEDFARSLPQRVSAMQDAVRGASFDQLTRMAHQLKGAGGSHGYSVVTEKAALIEQAAKNHATDGLTEKIVELRELIERIHAGLTPRA